MTILLRWVINASALIIIANLVSGVEINGWYAAFITALVLGLVNAVIRPLVIFFTLPVNVLTLGLFTFVINGLLFWFVSSIVQGFFVAGFWPAFWGALLMSITSGVVSMLLSRD